MTETIYFEYAFNIKPLQPASDILIAELGEAGFESFVEQENGLLAYIQKKDWRNGMLDGIAILSNPKFTIQYVRTALEQQNWNATWEASFEPIQIDGQCVVRAPFHAVPKVRFDIVIMPKMSFGTGHHETTHMMLQHILEHDFNGKSVLDMGSGTGVLAILAAMKGADRIDAIDIDHWCYLNAIENMERNNCTHVHVMEGDVHLLKETNYDIILANINRNILLKDIPIYTRFLNTNGLLFVSGFYDPDLAIISAKCEESGLTFNKKMQRNDWVSVKYVLS